MRPTWTRGRKREPFGRSPVERRERHNPVVPQVEEELRRRRRALMVQHVPRHEVQAAALRPPHPDVEPPAVHAHDQILERDDIGCRYAWRDAEHDLVRPDGGADRNVRRPHVRRQVDDLHPGVIAKVGVLLRGGDQAQQAASVIRPVQVREPPEVPAGRPRPEVGTHDHREVARVNRVSRARPYQDVDVERQRRRPGERGPRLEPAQRLVVQADHGLPLVERGAGDRQEGARSPRGGDGIRSDMRMAVSGGAAKPVVGIQQLQQRHLATLPVTRDERAPVGGERRQATR